MNPEHWYVVITMISSVISLGGGPVIGPMTKEQCEAVSQAIEVEEVASIAAIDCRRPRVFRACVLPDRPGYVATCPVWDHGPLVGPAEDQK